MATGKIQKPSFDLNSFPQPQNIISNTDFNNMVQSGVYLMTGGMTNSPFGGGYGMLIVLCNDYSSSSSQHKVRQIFIPESTDSVFIRKKYTGAWSGWVQVNSVFIQEDITNGVLPCTVKRYGSVCYLQALYVSPNQNVSANSWFTIGTVSTNFRPSTDAYIGGVFTTTTGTPIGFRGTVSTNGEIKITPNAAISTSTSLFGTVIYTI